MRRKKSIPLPEPDKQGFEYECPSAYWGDMTGIITTGEIDKKVDKVYKDIHPPRPEVN
ncbi:MAG: hypothetical protein J6Y71_01425 [Ruminococcus sp.]|nr:hypothetical protein [Ruminococcus sp.]